MAVTSDETLRALIRLIPPVQALKQDVEQSIQMELYQGTGELAVRSFQGLQSAVARLTDDPYVDSLALNVPSDADDRQKISLVRLAAGQLAAYLEGQTGLVNLGGGGHSGSGSRDVQFRSPNVLVNSPITGVAQETLDKIINMAAGAASGTGEGQGE